MTGAGHYAEAERLLRQVGSAYADEPSTLAAAQVHATLALAAAQAAQSQSTVFTALPEWKAVLE